jgi:pyruvate,water dikinase
VALRRLASGGTRAEPVEPGLVERLCLADSHLRALSQVALRCAEVFGRGPHDIEWAFDAGAPYLLQRRPIAATKTQPCR